MNYKMIGYILGWIIFFAGGFMAVPVITAIVYGEKELFAYLGVMLFCLIAGRIITLKRPSNSSLYSRDGFMIVALSWIVLSLFGALPMFLCGDIKSFIDALFESVSGFTTTGASIMASVEDASKATLIWRSFSHWIGGMGVLVFVMAFLPLSGGQNMHIMKAESPGPSVSKLVPKVKTTAFLLYAIYFILTLIEFVALLFGGLPVFDAICTSIATAGTGGFGVYNNSMAGFTPAIQIIVTVFMILFSINFNSYYLIYVRKFREAFTVEVKVFLLIVFSSIAIITLNISGMYEKIGDCIRHAAFAVGSVISTTGFATEDFNLWPEMSRTVLVLIMFIGACAGSTGGGIKVSRFLILFKTIGKELDGIIHPKQVKKIKIGSHEVEHEVLRSVNVYLICYFVVYVVSMLLISFDNHDLITNFTAVAATINNIGPGLEMVGPTANYAFFSDGAKFVLMFDMLAGRLELFPLLLLLKPSAWKK